MLKTPLLLGVALMSIHSFSYAQETVSLETSTESPMQSSGQSDVYMRADFDEYVPRTASDMVSRIPGFTINGGGNNNNRGLGQGGANILINGARISGKSIGPRTALSRIPASAVVRIEILDGTSLDIPGLSGKVANIVTTNIGLSGSWRYTAEFQHRSKANLLGFEASVTDSIGPFEYTLSAKNDPFRNTAPGPEDAFDADGNLKEHRDELAFFFRDRPSVSVDLTYAPDNGHIGHLNAQYQLMNFRTSDHSRHTAISALGETGVRLSDSGEDEWNMEIGADYALDLGPGNLKLISIWRHEDSENNSVFQSFSTTDIPFTSTYDQITLEGETIGRAEYFVKQNEKHDWQFAVEGAFNFLDRSSILNESDQPLPDLDASRVEEKRAEANITHGWKLTDNLNLQASASIEYSQLSQTGQAGKVREFIRPKGFISASYSPSDTFTVLTKIERRVGQLNFNTFVSTVDLSDDLKNLGNPDIVPPQFWSGKLQFEKQWPNGISGTLKFYGREIEDFVDRIAVPGGDAPGNIDTASLYGTELVGTIELDKFGLRGMQFDTKIDVRNSFIIDPFTGIERRLSNHKVSTYEFKLRHDIPDTDMAWSIFVENRRNSTDFRFDRTSHFTRGQPFVALNIEHKNILGLKVSAFMRNALSQDNNFTRSFWDGSRADGIFEGSEIRVRNQAPRFGINISGTI
ncbi:MAG: hypothetical protein COA69_02315 [Robiginitomaculum sp.]|nr:MAG: hypothetical protein COA69_02315 [Robiginitomaculum sp.]